MPVLSIIIPTYNEAENIPELMSRMKKALRGVKHEIIVVDDNSPDNTAEIARRLGAKVLVRPKKMGLTTAFLDGLKIATGDYVCLMDADLQHPPEILPKMLKEALNGADIVIASRYVKGGGIEGLNWLRRFISRIARFLAYFFLPKIRKIKDPISGAFIIKKDVVEGVNFSTRGYKALLEILVKAKYGKVTEVPYVFKKRLKGKSKLGVQELLEYLRLLLTLTDYRVLKFMCVGASGVIVNESALWALVTLNLPIIMASPLAIELSIVNNFVLNDIWTFKDKRTGNLLMRLLRYHSAVIIGALVNYIALLSLIFVGVNYLLANLMGIILGFFANYACSEAFVWR
ncbi:glycosyltransferase family 2 protein [Candidatus Geothermarchaeota archaeon]|nr:MAG: glycosyltransferase family 2 protein [Candidatus Geothermarchaeota archaeon]